MCAICFFCYTIYSFSLLRKVYFTNTSIYLVIFLINLQVADFGLSKMSEGAVDGDPSRQRFSSTCGSDFYMAPEVWGGLSYSAQADIFSLGVMLWAVLERITFLEEGSTQEQLGECQ